MGKTLLYLNKKRVRKNLGTKKSEQEEIFQFEKGLPAMLLLRALVRYLNTPNCKDLDYQRIQEIATEVNGQFAKDYSIWFKELIHREVDQENRADAQEFKLVQTPDPHRPVKTGHIRKLGSHVKNWKNRLFVAYNKANNYEIKYFEDDSMTKEKGHINCCGYSVERFNREEERVYGNFGFKLVHSDETKRIWYLRCESAKDMTDWMMVFAQACRKCVVDPHRPPLAVQAFRAALRSTKAAYGYFGVCEVTGPEEEVLSRFTELVLSREVLDEHMQTLYRTVRSQSSANPSTSSSAPNQTQLQMQAHAQMIRANVQNVVAPIVATTLKNCHANTDSLGNSYVLFVRSHLEALRDKEREVAALLAPQLQQLVDGLAYELKYEVCKPVLNKVFNALVAVLLETLRATLSALAAQLRGVGGSRTDHTLEALAEQVESPEAFLGEVMRLLDNFHTEQLHELQDRLEASEMTTFGVYCQCLDDIKRLAYNALATAAQRLAASLPVAQVLDDVARGMEHDGARMLHDRLDVLLKDCMESKVQDLIIAPALDRVYNAQYLLVSCPVNIHLACLGERLVRQRVDAFVSELLRPYDEDTRKQIQESNHWTKMQSALASS